MAKNFVKLFSGRKRESPAWTYFDYNPDTNKSRCLVLDEKTNKQCGKLTAGKNPTNLKAHLSTAHPTIASKLKEKEDVEKAVKRKQQDESKCQQHWVTLKKYGSKVLAA
jgi:hypothetical protein